MKSRSKKIALLFAMTLLVVLLGLVGMNVLLDSGARALKSGDDARALEILRVPALLGNTTAQELVGSIYAFGWGVPKDDEAAIKWFRRAAHGAEQADDPAAAAEYYVGESFAQGVQVGKSEDEALKWFRRSAEGGYVKAQDLLASAYENGSYGLARDTNQASYWRARAEAKAVPNR